MLPVKCCFIWQNGFRGEDFQKLTNKKQELPMAVMSINRSGQNEQSLQKTFQRSFEPRFDSFDYAVSEEKIKL